jgi:hypothetical protein
MLLCLYAPSCIVTFSIRRARAIRKYPNTNLSSKAKQKIPTFWRSNAVDEVVASMTLAPASSDRFIEKADVSLWLKSDINYQARLIVMIQSNLAQGPGIIPGSN